MRKLYYKTLTNAISKFFGNPQFLILYLTNDCWMKCRHCFYNEKFRAQNNITKDELTYDEIDKLAASIKKILYISFAGGEPFIRDDLEEIIKLFTVRKKVFRYQIPTSGYKTDLILDKTERILKDNRTIPFRVHVSLDGNESVQKKIRGLNDSFRKAIETIKELNKLKKKFDHFDVGVITTVCSYNQDIIEELSSIVEEYHDDGEWCINLLRGDPRNPEAGEIQLEHYIKANEIIDKRIKARRYKGYSGHLSSGWLSAKNAARRKIICKIISGKFKGGGCTAGSLGGIIYPDGSVYPCELLKNSFGNLKDYNFNISGLWNSADAKKLRNWIQDSECICTHECTLSTNFLIQPRTWPVLLSERLKLFVNT